ncbi:unnamed protein product [Agarophyton chilense]|eukprot:gb/GEZJ01004876.1/.p1 GENE.gb/GEZJ01004876.1/~~gb/GEZJ01004876.1/.p1  ORF type:complete len:235 (+),score=34.78 gb/GEZJ01004876.1/:1407-2111(+)
MPPTAFLALFIPRAPQWGGETSNLNKRRPSSSASRQRANFRSDLSQEIPPESKSNPFRITELQDKLDDALAAEKYICAASLRDQLRSAKNEDYIQVLQTLLQYYDAFNSHSLKRLGRMWQPRDDVTCQHPLTKLHRGYEAVLQSFESLFNTLPADLSIQVSDVRMQVFGHVAMVTCLEIPRSSVLNEMNKGIVQQHGLLSTSIFEKQRIGETDEFEYFMVHHTSAPVIPGVSTT